MRMFIIPLWYTTLYVLVCDIVFVLKVSAVFFIASIVTITITSQC